MLLPLMVWHSAEVDTLMSQSHTLQEARILHLLLGNRDVHGFSQLGNSFWLLELCCIQLSHAQRQSRQCNQSSKGESLQFSLEEIDCMYGAWFSAHFACEDFFDLAG